jgi:hypothetical protein
VSATADPYASPKPPAAEAPPSSDVSIGYMEAIRFPFQGPHAWMNILLISVANFVPVIGPIVVSGFIYDTFEALFRQKRTYAPPFDFDRLSEYLMRGVWLFLVQMIVSFIFVMPSTMVFMVLHFAGMAMLDQGGDTAVLGGVFIGVGFLLHFAVMSLMGFLMIPLVIRVGLAQDFARGFDFAWFRSFLGKMWVEMIVVTLVLTFLSIGYVFIGFALFCVGVFFLAGILFPTSMYLQYQLYLVFLGRGGKPVELKEPSPKALAVWAR